MTLGLSLESEPTWLLFCLCLPGEGKTQAEALIDPLARLEHPHWAEFPMGPLGHWAQPISRGQGNNSHPQVLPSCASAVLAVLSLLIFCSLSAVSQSAKSSTETCGNSWLFGSNRTRHTTHMILFLASTSGSGVSVCTSEVCMPSTNSRHFWSIYSELGRY